MTKEAVQHEQHRSHPKWKEVRKCKNKRQRMKELALNVFSRPRKKEHHITPSFFFPVWSWRSLLGSFRQWFLFVAVICVEKRKAAVVASWSSLIVRVALVPLLSWKQEIDGVTQQLLPVWLPQSHTNTDARSRLHTNMKSAGLPSANAASAWPVLSWQADQTKRPICSLMVRAEPMRCAVVPLLFGLFFFFHFRSALISLPCWNRGI